MKNDFKFSLPMTKKEESKTTSNFFCIKKGLSTINIVSNDACLCFT